VTAFPWKAAVGPSQGDAVINPAGWYPQPDGQQRYWDGQRWTGYRTQGISVVRRRPGARRRWLREHKVIATITSVLLLGASLGAAEIGAKTDAEADVPAVPLAESAASRRAAAARSQPKDQAAFLTAVVEGRDRYLSTDNELKQELVLGERDRDLCSSLPGDLEVKDWVGVISHLHTSGGGEGVLEVEFGNSLKVRLGNDFLAFDKRFIPVVSKAYRNLAELREGTPIHFSGRFIEDRDACLQERGWSSQRIESPHFSFQFSGVK
jgi:Protein of unknown function (DUF2510)